MEKDDHETKIKKKENRDRSDVKKGESMEMNKTDKATSKNNITIDEYFGTEVIVSRV